MIFSVFSTNFLIDKKSRINSISWSLAKKNLDNEVQFSVVNERDISL